MNGNGVEYYDADGVEYSYPLGQTADQEPAWWERLISTGGNIAEQVTRVKAAKEIAKTGEVPKAQLDVGLAPETKQMLTYGGIALAGLALLMVMGKKRR